MSPFTQHHLALRYQTASSDSALYMVGLQLTKGFCQLGDVVKHILLSTRSDHVLCMLFPYPGLEVSVAFGGVWKESLTELSGGQRSLLALSLVLALCRFKPAPIYILDEVDAALDLNHTQNIGAMIKTHFPQVRCREARVCVARERKELLVWELVDPVMLLFRLALAGKVHHTGQLVEIMLWVQ